MKNLSFMGFTPDQEKKYFRPKDSSQEKQLIEETVDKFENFKQWPSTKKMLDGDSLELDRITPQGYKGVSWALTLKEKCGISRNSWEHIGFDLDKNTIKALIKSTMLYVGIEKYNITPNNTRKIIKTMFEKFYKT